MTSTWVAILVDWRELWLLPQSTHRVAIADFGVHSIMIADEGGVVRPPPFTIVTITYKVAVYAPVPEIIDPVFAKTSPKRSFSMTEYERLGLVFTKTRVYKFGHSWVGSYTRPVSSLPVPIYVHCTTIQNWVPALLNCTLHKLLWILSLFACFCASACFCTASHPPPPKSVAEFIDSWQGNKVNSGIGLSYRHAWLHGWRASTTTLCRSWLSTPVRGLWIRLLVARTDWENEPVLLQKLTIERV